MVSERSDHFKVQQKRIFVHIHALYCLFGIVLISEITALCLSIYLYTSSQGSDCCATLSDEQVDTPLRFKRSTGADFKSDQSRFDHSPSKGENIHRTARHHNRNERRHQRRDHKNQKSHRGKGDAGEGYDPHRHRRANGAGGGGSTTEDDSEPVVEFFPPPKGVDRGDAEWVWLTSYSRIPVRVMQEFCKATQEYCPPGPEGPIGISGTPGQRGEKGEQGDLGYPGDSGDPGPQGRGGLPGPLGPRGERGEPGNPGLDGVDGLGGEPGLDGIPGRDGIDGIPGKDGTPGIDGIPGNYGINGTNGIPGDRGPIGPSGIQGITGLPGPRGKKGIDGRSGTPGTPGITAWSVNTTEGQGLLIPPIIVDQDKIRQVTIAEGSNLRLRCTATGRPEPRVVWRKDGALVPLGSWYDNVVDGTLMNITHITREHIGTYMCTASNGVPPVDTRTVHVEVHFKPRIEISRPVVISKNGTNAILECKVEASPEALNYWLAEDGRLIENSLKYRIHMRDSGYRVFMTLNITNVDRRDYGQYKCVSKNEQGLTMGNITLYEFDSRLPRPFEEPTVFGPAPPNKTDLDDLCPRYFCPDCPKQRICPDRRGYYGNVQLVNHGFNHTWPPLKPRILGCMIDLIGKPVYQRYTKSDWGAWMQDGLPSNRIDEMKYWITKENDSKNLYEFADKVAYRTDNITTIFRLTDEWMGNSHLVYGGSFYYNKDKTQKMIRYDLTKKKTLQHKEVPYMAYTNGSFLYENQLSYLDFSADENGLWVVFGMTESNNTIVLKFDPETLESMHMWNLSLNHKTVGDTFVACGVLYALESTQQRNSHIRFAFDLYQNKILDVEVPFTNPFRQNSMVSYNPNDKVIYSWDKGNQLTYPLKFMTIPTEPPPDNDLKKDDVAEYK